MDTQTQIVGVVISCIIWAVRLEAKVKQNERELEVHKQNHEATRQETMKLFKEALEKLGKVTENLARLEGRLESLTVKKD